MLSLQMNETREGMKPKLLEPQLCKQKTKWKLDTEPNFSTNQTHFLTMTGAYELYVDDQNLTNGPSEFGASRFVFGL